jgi:hypothetical protein
MNSAVASPDVGVVSGVEVAARASLSVRLRQLQLLAEKRTQLKAKNGLAFYRPHTKQGWFHSCMAKLRYWRTGNRFGKSDMGAAEDCAFALGERPWLPTTDPARYAGIPLRATKGVIIVADWKKAREIFTMPDPGQGQGKLFKFLPVDSIVGVSKGGQNIEVISVKSKHGGVSQIFIMTVASFQLDKKKGESSSWDWIHVDEPIPKDMWTAVSRGLIDNNGRAWFTCTPISEPWINAFFVPPKLARKPLPTDRVCYFGHNSHDPARAEKAVCSGSSYDNPYTSRQGLYSFMSNLSDSERRAREEGIPLEMTGMIYNVPDELLYDDPPDGWELPNLPPKSYTISVAIDSHPATPMAALFIATAPNGLSYVYDEIFQKLTTEELATEVLARLDGYTVACRLIEPAAFIEDQRNQSCLAHDLGQFGLYVLPASKDLRRGIMSVQLQLKRRTLFFNNNLPVLGMELSSYVWKAPDKPRDCDDHLMECLYRLCLTDLPFIDNANYDVSEFKFSSQLT